MNVALTSNIAGSKHLSMPGFGRSSEGLLSVRIHSLTGLRFIAALYVVLFHSIANPQNGGGIVSLPWIAPFVSLGYLGVTFFFVLSGFVLSIADTTITSFFYFYRKRFARIYPLHALTLAISGLGQVILYFKSDVFSLIFNILLLQAWIPDPSVYFGMNGVSWSLSNEMFFYALFPFVMLARQTLLRASRLLLPVCIAVSFLGSTGLILQAFHVSSETLWVNPLFGFIQFFSGVLLGLRFKSGSLRCFPLLPTYVMTAVCLVLLLIADHSAHEYYGAALSRTLASSVFLPFILNTIGSTALSERSGQSTIFNHRAFVKLGEYSFALYLSHPLLIAFLTKIIGLQRNLVSTPSAVLIELLFLCGSVVMSGFLYEFFERPLERLLRPKRAVLDTVKRDYMVS